MKNDEEKIVRGAEAENDALNLANPVQDFVEMDSDQIPSTDIVFECPTCGKSLSIDCKGAGLVITCTGCGNLVTVPIPEGMDLYDLDSSPEDMESQMIKLRNVLAARDAQIAGLVKQIADLADERDSLLSKMDEVSECVSKAISLISKANIRK